MLSASMRRTHGSLPTAFYVNDWSETVGFQRQLLPLRYPPDLYSPLLMLLSSWERMKGNPLLSDMEKYQQMLQPLLPTYLLPLPHCCIKPISQRHLNQTFSFNLALQQVRCSPPYATKKRPIMLLAHTILTKTAQ